MKQSRVVGMVAVGESFFLINYGSFFQHYALRKVICEFGFRPYRVLFRSRLRSLIKYFLTPFFIWHDLRGTRILWRRRFVKDYHTLIGRVYEKQNRESTYAYVVGSDAVWISRDEKMYLIGPQFSKRKISYAASSIWELFSYQDWWKKCMTYVGNTFYAVSVREEFGRSVCQTLMPQQKVSCVVDPTMLLEKEAYLKIIPQDTIFLKPTLLYYVVNVGDIGELLIDRIEQVARTLGCDLKIVGIQGAERCVPVRYLIHPSPRDFLRCVRDSKYVITNSFHGSVFSMIFQKQFVFVTQRKGSRGNQNRRQEGVLEKMGILCRRVPFSTFSATSVVELLKQPIDYADLSVRQSRERTNGLDWLKKALS